MIMKNFTSHDRFASDIETDDWFRMGGFLYRVTHRFFVQNAEDPRDYEVELVCCPVHDPKKKATICVSPKQIFKIYNQK
jgi:Na+-transporting NADH:ubiquinone oxidoreductase subunit NqrF